MFGVHRVPQSATDILFSWNFDRVCIHTPVNQLTTSAWVIGRLFDYKLAYVVQSNIQSAIRIHGAAAATYLRDMREHKRGVLYTGHRRRRSRTITIIIILFSFLYSSPPFPLFHPHSTCKTPRPALSHLQHPTSYNSNNNWVPVVRKRDYVMDSAGLPRVNSLSYGIIYTHTQTRAHI